MVDMARQAGVFVRSRIKRICEGSDPVARATLARLRRGIGKAPGSVPDIWEVTMRGLPEGLAGTTGKPTPGEWASHTALTLYALHQQGKDPRKQCMSAEGASLGRSVRKLVGDGDDEKRLSRRLSVVTTSDTVEELAHHLRGLIQLLKTKDVPLDYPDLTEDLYRFQFPGARDSVRLHWGRDFYHVSKEQQTETQATMTNEGRGFTNGNKR